MENAAKANTELEFRDLLKRVWSAAKDIDAANRHRLLVFFIGAGALCGNLSRTATAPVGAPAWIEAAENCLAHFLKGGKQPATGDPGKSAGDATKDKPK